MKKKKFDKYDGDIVTIPSKREKSKRERTREKEALDFANDPKTGKPMRMEKEDYDYSMGGPVKKYMEGGKVSKGKKYMEGGKVSKGKKYKQSVRGAGCATQGVRKAKMR
jgi:hypothetical protein